MSIPNNPLPVDPNKKMNPLLGQASGEGSPVSGPPVEEPDYILGGPLEENLPEGDPNDPFQEDVSAQYNEEQDFDPYEIGGVIPGEWGNPDEEAPLTGQLEPKPLTEDEWSPDTGGGSITGQLEGITATPLEGKAAEVRTARYQFALGDPYTREELYNAIRTGTEDSIRKKVAALADIKDRQAKLDVIKEKAASGKPITPEDVALMANISNFQPFNDPKTIIERQYATRYFDTMFGLNTDSRSVMQQAYRTNPEKLSERKTHYETLVAKQEIIKGIIESVDSMYQQQSWIGWGVDQAKLMFPLYSSAKLRASTSGAESLKEGEIIQDLVFKYRTLPLSQMADTMRKEILNIAKDNPSLAKKLAEAVLFYTKSDASFDNFVSVADALTFPGLGTAFRGARRGVQAVRDLRAGKATEEAVQGAVQGATEAPKAAAGTTIPNKPPEGHTRYYKVEETWRGPDQKSMEFTFPTPTKQGELFPDLPTERRLDRLPESMQPKPKETMSEMADRLRAKWGINDQLELDLSVKRTPGQDVLEAQRPGSQMDLFGDTSKPKPTKKEDFDPTKVDNTTFRTWKEAVNFMKGSQSTGRIFVVDVDPKTGIVKTYETDAAKVTNGKVEVVKQDPVETAFQAGVKANADPQVNPAKVLNEVGDVERSAQVTNTNMLRGELAAKNGATPPKDQVFEEIQRRLPSFSNSTKIVEGGPTNLARGRIEIFAQNLQRITDEFTERLRSETKIQRLPEETLELAIRANTEKLVADRANHLQNLVLDVGHVRPEDTRANVGSVSVSFGNREMKPFETADDARKVAQNDYGFAPGTFKVEQAGIGGYKITLTAPIDETLPVVRQNLNLGGNRAEPSTARTFFGRILSADNRVPEFQRANRLSVVHNKSFMDGIVKEFTKEVGRLSKKQADEVQSVMHADKFEVNQPLSVKAGKEILGVYRETVEEFEKAFHSIHGKFPTEAQVKSYFTWRRLNDMDYMIRNLNTYREMSRMGWQEVVVLDRTVDDAGKVVNSKDRFHGKIVDELPIYHKDDTGVVIHTSGQTPKSFRLRDIKNNPELMQEIKTLQEQGYKIVHNVNPVRTVMDGKLSKGDTGFIITKDVEVHPLREVQIKYRPGWHNEYAQTDYVKVPIIDENGRYLGDQAIFGFHASGPAKKYAAAMEEARKALLRGDDAAIDRVKNLPMTSKDFKKLFQERIDPTTGEVIPAKLNIKAPFLHINEGRTLGDVYQNTLRESLGTFENLVDNAFNEMKHIDKKFMGQRNGPLETVIERMDPNGQPLLTIGMADQVDPIQSMRNTIANVTRSRYFDDYRNAHVEGWVQQFGHLLNVPKEELLGNPAAHFYEPKFGKHANFEEVRLAEDSRRAALELLGTPDAISQAIDHTRAKMLEQVYEKKGMEALNEKARKYIRKEDQETAGLLRAVAFHPTMGMFNPYQLFQNAMTTVNAIAIAGPVNGMKGVATTLPMRWVYSNERLLDTMANQSRAYGWKPEWFKEVYGELKKTGRLVIEGENAYMSNMSNPNPISTRWGDFLEAGTVFFREGERFNRIAAHSMAYLEWRTANPTAKITNSVSLQIMQRADDMTANMTRASNAGYQYGLTSIPAQFTSYFTRLSEQMLGKKITPAEKARVIALNSLVFGVPVGLLGASGLGALTFGQFPGGEAFRKWMYNQRVDMNDEAVDAFMNGVLGMAARAVSGVPTDLSAKVGPGGGSLIKDLFFEDKSFVEAIFGASGSTVGSLWRALDPGIKWSMSMFKGGENTYQFRPEDVVNILRIVKSADHVHNIYWAAQTQKYFAKTGQTETGTNQPFTVTQAVVRALTGAMPATMTDRILLQTMSIDRQKLLRETLTKVAPSLAAGMAAADRGDMELAEVYRQRVMFIFDLADFTPQERAQAWLEVAKQHRGRIDKVWMDFYTKNVPMSKRPKSMETFGKEIERQNQNNPQQEER